MDGIGPALFAAGVALLFVPLAEMMGTIGYVLYGAAFVIVGALLTAGPDIVGGGAGGVDRKNCPRCGAPNGPSALTCAHCDTALP